ncbi:MAG: anthranilate phosphoribosyltransferase, partial [Actinomycetota bacterium]
MWDQLLDKLTSRQDLSVGEIRFAMTEILEGRAGELQIKEFLLGMKNKGERAEEVRALVDEMYGHVSLIDIPDRAVEIVGTGGDGFNTINISTSAAIV